MSTSPKQPTAKTSFTEKKYLTTFIFVTSLFMLWGIAITMGDVLNKHFQNVLHISRAESGLVQFSIFGAYAVMGIPAGIFMKRYGYKNGVLLGLLLYAIGAFLFTPAADAGSFGYFRFALFVLACGLATLEAVAHPFVGALGSQNTSDQRINFAQSFNGLGAVIGPLIGGFFILQVSDGDTNSLDSVKLLYQVIGGVILAIAIAFWFVKVPPLQDPHAADKQETTVQTVANPLKQTHFRWAVLAQLFNTAAQGGTWAFFINYGVEKMQFEESKAAYYFAFSMVLMMVGRFVGTYLMRFISANKLLAGAALGNIIMCLLIAQNLGWVSFIALLMLNFFFSIMFPSIFSLGLKNMGDKVETASSFLVMAVVGGAIFPPIMGLVADIDAGQAYYLPIICYIVIFLFGYKYSKIPGQE